MTRYDELANEEEIKRERSSDKMLKTGANALATTAIGYSGLPAKIAPFLSNYIPTDLALKGINKVAPKLGKILESGMKQGLSIKDGLDYLKDNLPEKPEEKEKNIIKKYAPHLDNFIQQELAAGKEPGQVINEAWKKDKKIVQQIEKDAKRSWLEIAEDIYGFGKKKPNQEKISPENAQPMQNQPQNGSNWNQIAEMLKKTLAS